MEDTHVKNERTETLSPVSCIEEEEKYIVPFPAPCNQPHIAAAALTLPQALRTGDFHQIGVLLCYGDDCIDKITEYESLRIKLHTDCMNGDRDHCTKMMAGLKLQTGYYVYETQQFVWTSTTELKLTFPSDGSNPYLVLV
jgi:hypothetical protein